MCCLSSKCYVSFLDESMIFVWSQKLNLLTHRVRDWIIDVWDSKLLACHSGCQTFWMAGVCQGGERWDFWGWWSRYHFCTQKMYVAVFINIVTVLQRCCNSKEWRTCSRRGGDNGGDERSCEFVEGAMSVVASGYDEVCLIWSREVVECYHYFNCRRTCALLCIAKGNTSGVFFNHLISTMPSPVQAVTSYESRGLWENTTLTRSVTARNHTRHPVVPSMDSSCSLAITLREEIRHALLAVLMWLRRSSVEQAMAHLEMRMFM